MDAGFPPDCAARYAIGGAARGCLEIPPFGPRFVANGNLVHNPATMNPPIDISEERGVRYLHFGSEWIQGAMRIARPWSLELDYTREMMLALLLRPQPHWPRSALMVGLGAASLPKFLWRHRPRAKLTVVEIAPRVVAAARHYFKLPDDPRLRIHVGDGAEYVAHARRRFDLILVDAFDADARAGYFNTEAFYRSCRARLTADGLLVVNLLRRARSDRAGSTALRDAFDGRIAALPATEGGNTIVFASAGAPVRTAPGALAELAARLKLDTGLDLAPTLQRAAARGKWPSVALEF